MTYRLQSADDDIAALFCGDVPAPKPATSSNPMQGDANWLAERVGCLTASRVAEALDKLKNGKPSKASDKLAMELVAERMTGSKAHHYVTGAMQHGIDTEPAARKAYEQATGHVVTLTGFHLHPSIEFFGASPDGLIADDGLVEIKCPTTTAFLEWVKAGVVPDEHKPQMLAQLACTGRHWCDFAAFDPRMQDPTMRLFVRRFQPKAEDIETVAAACADFLRYVDAMFETITGMEMAA